MKAMLLLFAALIGPALGSPLSDPVRQDSDLCEYTCSDRPHTEGGCEVRYIGPRRYEIVMMQAVCVYIPTCVKIARKLIFFSGEATPRVPASDGQQEEDVVELLESAKIVTR